jgi:hypothetical protein
MVSMRSLILKPPISGTTTYMGEDLIADKSYYKKI